MGFHGLEFQANITAWDGKENVSENANDPKTTPTSLKESIPFKKEINQVLVMLGFLQNPKKHKLVQS